ncbi:unnamed protein product [Malus baccata var. baccata]
MEEDAVNPTAVFCIRLKQPNVIIIMSSSSKVFVSTRILGISQYRWLPMMVSASTAQFGVLVKFPGRGVSSKLFVLEWLPSLTSTTESLFAFPLSPVLSLFLISIEFLSICQFI